MIERFPTFPLTVSRDQAASVKAGVQTTTTRGEQSVNGRTDAMHAPNVVVSCVDAILVRAANCFF